MTSNKVRLRRIATLLVGAIFGTAFFAGALAPAAHAASASPSTGPTSGGNAVTVTGSNFDTIIEVTVDDLSVSYSLVNSSTVTVYMPAHSAGSVSIEVIYEYQECISEVPPWGCMGYMPVEGYVSANYTYESGPAVSSVSPNSGSTVGGTSVAISGANFSGVTSVTFGGVAATFTVASATQINATVPAHAAGAVSVVVTDSYGTSTLSSGFTYDAPPSITSLSVSTGSTAGGTQVTISGSNLSGSTSVTFAGTNALVTSSTSTSITVSAPAQAAGTVSVAVLNSYGSSTLSNAFTYGAPPTITTVSPAAGSTGGGTTVTLTGTNFSSANMVYLNAAPVSFTLVSPTSITFRTPSSSAGAVPVAVTTAYGTVTASNAFTYGNAPTISNVSPNSGDAGASTIPGVVITGANFTGATSVTFGAVAGTSMVVNSATQITVTAPANAVAGAYSVVVTTPDGSATAAAAFTYGNAPTISAVSPNEGPLNSVVPGVVISGANLTTANAVTFGGVSATSIVVNSATQITVTAPSAAVAGAVTVAVATPTYGTATLANGFTYASAPAITSVSPNSGMTAGGATVTINGSNFTGATQVTFGGTVATSLTVVSGSQITVSTPARASGAVSVQVTTPAGSATLSNAFTYYSPPAITSVSPSSGPTMGYWNISVIGSNFIDITAVKFGGVAQTITLVTPTELMVQSTSGTAGTVSVQVIGAYGSSTLSNAFTFVAPPVINAVSPPNGDAGTTTSNVIISGSLLSNASSVTFGGTAATFVVNSSTQITATAPSRSAGAVPVAVTTPGGTAQLSNGFTYGTAPTITSVSPKTGVGSGTNPGVVITGANLSGGVVTFGGTAGTVTASSASSLTVTAPAHADGAVDVVVTTVYGTATATNAYTYGSLPAIDGVVPSSGTTLGGTRVTITGANFTSSPLPTVTIGGVAATSVTFVSTEQLTAVVPAGSAGAASVVVTTTYGSNTLTNGYTYGAPPTVASVSPTIELITGGTTVTISGSGFTGATSVTFGGTPATSFSVSNSGQITAVAPAFAAGTVSVAVTTSYGTGTLTSAVTYGSAPTVTGMTPRVGDANVATPGIVITGTNLSGATVLFGSVAGTITNSTSTSLTVTAPSQSAGAVNVTVTTAFGSTTVANGFSYGNLPGISLVTSNTGSTGGNRVVIIDGSFLSGTTSVQFGSANASSFTVQSSTQIVAVTPPGAAGTVSVTVITPYGSVTKASAYTYGLSPQITAVSPDSGSTSGGQYVTITGSNLSGTTGVFIGGAESGSVTVVSPSQVVAMVPARGSGSRSIAIGTPYGIASVPLAYTFIAPAGMAPTADAAQPTANPEVIDAALFGGVCPLGWTTGYASWANSGLGGKVCSAPAGTPIPVAIDVAGSTGSPFINVAINRGVLGLLKHLKTQVTFEPNSSELSAEAMSTLRQYAKKVNAHANSVTTVEGVVQVTALNDAATVLAQARAKAVAAYLRTIGILGQVRVLPGLQEFNTNQAGFAKVRSAVRGQKR